MDRQDFLTYAKSEIKSGSIKDFVSSIDCKLSSGTIQEKCDVVVPLDEDLYDDLVTLLTLHLRENAGFSISLDRVMHTVRFIYNRYVNSIGH